MGEGVSGRLVGKLAHNANSGFKEILGLNRDTSAHGNNQFMWLANSNKDNKQNELEKLPV